MRLGSRLSKFRLAENKIQPKHRSFSCSTNSTSQKIQIDNGENPFKDYRYDINKRNLLGQGKNPTCNVILNSVGHYWSDTQAFRYLPVIAVPLYADGFKAMKAVANPSDLTAGFVRAFGVVDEHLRHTAKKISSSEEIVQFGITYGDRRIGELIAKAVEKVGNKSSLFISDEKIWTSQLEFDNGMEFGLEFVNKMQLDWFQVFPYETVLENPFILILGNGTLTKNVVAQAIRLITDRRPLLIFAEAVDLELAECLRNPECIGSKVCVVKPRERKENHMDIIQDLAIFSGGQVATEVSDVNLIPMMLGSCKEARISSFSTILLCGSGSQANIEEGRDKLSSTIQMSPLSSDQRKLLEARLANLSRTAAIFKVGGASEEKMHENKKKIVNALNCVMDAIEVGIVPGGGVALLHASKLLDKLQVTNSTEKLGVQLFQHALKMPMYSIASAAGFDRLVAVEKLLEQDNPNLEYDSAGGEYVDMIHSKNMDPYGLVSKELSALIDDYLFYGNTRFYGKAAFN